jgi:threonine/homoserine/homoserine lactone efflux protein
MIVSLLLAIAEGIGLGLTLAILTGPAFFALLQTSIRNGVKSGIAFALGVFISDTLLILLAYLGALRLVNDPKNNFIIGIIGGTILIMFGLFNMFQKHPLDLKEEEEKVDLIFKKINLPLIGLKGFVINLINPFVILFWVGVVSVESTRYDFSRVHVISLFTALLFTILFTDILKAMAAHKITSFLKYNVILWINRIAGIILVICGVTLIVRVLEEFI